MLPRLWLLVGSDRPTDRPTDRQCHLLSCPGQLKTWIWALVFLHARVLISGVSINIKTWVFYQGWFPRFGFFISRPYAVFYTMKVVFFFIKECTFYSFQLFLKPKQWFCHFLSVWRLVVRCHFGFWPLDRFGFVATFNLIRPVLSFYKIG